MKILKTVLFTLTLIFIQRGVFAESPTVLGPGINISEIINGQSISNLQIKKISTAGFRAIRQPISEAALGADCNVTAAASQKISERARSVIANGMIFVLDFHPGKKWKDSFFEKKQYSCLINFWTSMTNSFRGESPKIVFEILNEPGKHSIGIWWDLQEKIIDSIKKIDKNRLLLVSGEGSDSPYDLINKKTYDTGGLVYVFHDYIPMIFTHQGANWGTASRYQKYRGTMWPIENSHNGKLFREISLVAAWASRNNVRVVCDEFGVYRNGGVAVRDRLAYFHDITKKLNEFGIDWMIWQYEGGFGIDGGADAKGVLDRDSLKALGLMQ